MREAIVPFIACSLACGTLLYGIPKLIRGRQDYKKTYHIELYEDGLPFPKHIFNGKIQQDMQYDLTNSIKLVIEFK